MGAGKTAVGSVLACRLGVSFRDTDADVEATVGAPVSEVFVEHGEQVFRALERAAVLVALAEHTGVLALGGGAVLDPGTRAALAGRPVVRLTIEAATAVRRVGLDAPRPMLPMGNPRAEWKRLAAAREPLYAEVTRWAVATDEVTPEQAADQIVQLLSQVAVPQGGPDV